MEIAQTQRITVLPDVLIQELQGESVLLNVNSGRYFGLDEVGTRMWAVLTSSESIEQACETLLAEYDVEGEKLRQDVTDLIAKLVEHGLVEVHDS